MLSEAVAGIETAKGSSGRKEKAAETLKTGGDVGSTPRSSSTSLCCPHPLIARVPCQPGPDLIQRFGSECIGVDTEKAICLEQLFVSRQEPAARAGVGWRDLGTPLTPPPPAWGAESSWCCARLRAQSEIMSSGIMRCRCPGATVICLDLAELIRLRG